MYKIIIFIILIYNLQSANSTTLSWGYIRDGQVLLFDQFFHDRDDLCKLEPREFFFSTLGARISAIHVTDLTGDEGGSAEIVQGGIGFTYVKLKLIPNDHILLLNVEIFGAHDERFS